MSRNRLFFLMLGSVATLTLSGCGEFAYKTGAGGDALDADRKACKMSAPGAVSYSQCMHDKGWSISNLDGGDDATAATAPAAVAGTAPTADTPATPAPAAAASMPPPPAPPPPPAADPMAPVKITAWVKFGPGGPDDDIAACVATLGPANQPDKANKTVTRALLNCMRAKGWRGY